jgi:D-alanyl-D-alanine carboxypeptidase
LPRKISLLSRVPPKFGRLAAMVVAVLVALPTIVSANPVMVVDVGTGRVLEHREAFRKWYPASLTKLMTAYTTFKAIRRGEVNLQTPVTMTKRAASEPPSRIGFKVGSQMTLDSALKILLVKSANDVAVAVAETVGGSLENFMVRMNTEAAGLGMTSSRFVNPHGLPGAGQYTTARDLAILAVALRREFPEYAGYFALEGIDTGKHVYANYNLLIGRFDGADGMKTGYICASGFNQISSATRNGRTVISVVLGADSLGARADISADLLQKALVSRPEGPKIEAIAPYGEGRETVTDISAQICNPKARQVRSEGRDEAGRMKMLSPYIHELAQPPRPVFAGIIPGTEPVETKPEKTKPNKIANVPIPIPRPTF